MLKKIRYKSTHLISLIVYSVFASALWTSDKRRGPGVFWFFFLNVRGFDALSELIYAL